MKSQKVTIYIRLGGGPKHNPTKPVVGLLKSQDWPVIEDREPETNTVEEVLALQSVATDFERLLIRCFIGTGCRDMEVATLEWDDIDFVRIHCL